MRLPFVIDNRSDGTSTKRVLADLLAMHERKSMDVAPAFFSINGYWLLVEGGA